MYIATGLTDVVVFQAAPSELAPENKEQLIKKISEQQPAIIGSDVIGDMGAKLHFIDNPVFEEKEDTLIKCTIHTKLTINKNIAAITGIPEVFTHEFTGYAKCSESDKKYYDIEFGKRLALSKAKNHAYSFCKKMFMHHIQEIHKCIITMMGFSKKMETLIDNNIKYSFNLCNSKYSDYSTNNKTNNESENIVSTVAPVDSF